MYEAPDNPSNGSNFALGKLMLVPMGAILAIAAAGIAGCAAQ